MRNPSDNPVRPGDQATRSGGRAPERTPPPRGGTPVGTPPPMRPRGCMYWIGLFFTSLLLNYLIVFLFFPDASRPVEVPYNAFREQVAADNVVAIATRGDLIQGEFRN